MYSNKVWTFVELPVGVNLIGCKWIYKKKIKIDEKIETYEARLVAKGYNQKKGIDYKKTFSPVVMLKSIRILLSIVHCRLRDMADGCQDCLSQWAFRRRHLYATTRRVQS